jgi:hypothetical protein
LAYLKTTWATGDIITATKLNNLETQYNEVKAEVEKTDGTSGIKPDWTNVKSKPTSFTPSAHKSTHASGGSDAITPADIKAAPSSHVGSGGSAHSLVTTSVHGFMSSSDKSKLNSLSSVSESASGSYTIPSGTSLTKNTENRFTIATGLSAVTIAIQDYPTVHFFFDYNGTRQNTPKTAKGRTTTNIKINGEIIFELKPDSDNAYLTQYFEFSGGSLIWVIKDTDTRAEVSNIRSEEAFTVTWRAVK